MKEAVEHPEYYGGKGNPYEAIKVIENWQLGFNLGNTVKYISRAGKKGPALEDLKKAAWYLNREIANLESEENRAKKGPYTIFQDETGVQAVYGIAIEQRTQTPVVIDGCTNKRKKYAET